MRIVAISDTHNYHNHYDTVTLPPADLLIHAGDMTHKGSLEELESFNEWLGGLDYEHKIVIAGNHDWCFQRQAKEARETLSSAHYLQDSGLEIEGLFFWGSPWQPKYNRWAFNLERGEQLRARWDLIPDRVDVLITHGPPRGIGDRVKSGERVGCEDLLERTRGLKPKLHIFGHVHEDYGVTESKETLYVNASFLDRKRRPCQPPHLLSVSAEQGRARVLEV